MCKNHLYKDKVPSFPPKRLMRKSKEVIDERKRLLTEYMNQLSMNINIFRDELIMGFLKQDFNSVQISNLAHLQEKFISDLNELELEQNTNMKNSKNSKKSTASRNSIKVSAMKELSIIQADSATRKSNRLNVQVRKRGMSDETDLMADAFSPLTRVTVQWNQRKFKNVEERINSWLEEMHTNVGNQSQLIGDLQDYYFGEKPIIPVDLLKRLFYGYLKHHGILNHLKECHKEPLSIKTRALMNFIPKLLDYNKSHQIEEISQIWKSLKPDDIKACHFELMINGQQQIKESALTLLKVYLDGKLFKVSDLIKDEKFAQIFHVWQTNKSRLQTSFTSTSSLGGSQTPTNRNNRNTFNSFACNGQPHFGACKHCANTDTDADEN